MEPELPPEKIENPDFTEEDGLIMDQVRQVAGVLPSTAYDWTGRVAGKSCGNCIHLHPHTLFSTCDAFPRGVPTVFLNNDEFHGKPFPGDRGIQWEPRPETAVDELLEALD